MDVSTFILNKVLSEIYTEVKTYLKRKDIRLLRDENFVKTALFDHINFVNNWSGQIAFKDLDKSKTISKAYVALNYTVNLKRDNLLEVEPTRIELGGVLGQSNKHIVILGQPGAGKTTTMKFICQSIFHSEKFHPEYQFPIIVRLRDLSDDSFSKSNDFLFDRLFAILGLKIDKEETQYAYSSLSVRECVIKMVEALRVVIILDGFDEINPQSKKEKILKEFEYLCLHLKKARVILTSRIGDYSYSIENTEVYEISSLSEDQIGVFAKKWLGSSDKYLDLLSQIRRSPFYDTAIRPLTMAHLCAIYERYGRIPDKPKSVYKKIINLLVEEWDTQRMITRKSNFIDFTPDRKAEFLSILAFKLTSVVKGSVFSKSAISQVYKEIHSEFSFDLSDERKVIQEIEGQTGLFLQSGYDSFEFAHKSLQEYLAAEYIVKLPSIPSDRDLIILMPNEFAISTSISIDSSIYFATLVIRHFAELDNVIVRIFLTRILLENPDFRQEPFLGAAILYLRRLNKIGTSCDDLIHEIIRKKVAVKNSILELTNYYRCLEVLPNEEIILHSKKSYRKFNIEIPLAVQVNRTILGILDLNLWPA